MHALLPLNQYILQTCPPICPINYHPNMPYQLSLICPVCALPTKCVVAVRQTVVLFVRKSKQKTSEKKIGPGFDQFHSDVNSIYQPTNQLLHRLQITLKSLKNNPTIKQHCQALTETLSTQSTHLPGKTITVASVRPLASAHCVAVLMS